jgi:hypothetical protein
MRFVRRWRARLLTFIVWVRRDWPALVSVLPAGLLVALLLVIQFGRATGLYELFGPERAPRMSAAYVAGTAGYDISWPQCDLVYPTTLYDFGIVGVTGGRPYTRNACLASEYSWAMEGISTAPALYMNLDAPSGPSLTYGETGPIVGCASGDTTCQAYNYGYGAAQAAVAYAHSQSAQATTWWLDIEMDDAWTSDTALNYHIIQGAIAYLKALRLSVGIYSTPYQWAQIAGNNRPGLPVWVAGAPTNNPAAYCSSGHGFGGGPIWLVQYADGQYDGDYAC